jgi:tetratricopeptide (TPR) repeat protein
MRLTLSVFCLLASLSLWSQSSDTEALKQSFDSKNYDQVIEKTLRILDNSPDKVELSLLLGRAYFHKAEYRTAIPYLEVAANNGIQNINGMAYLYLGRCYFMTGDQAKSEINLQAASTSQDPELAKEVKYLMPVFGFHEAYKTWTVVESEHIRFHFQNMADSSARKFVESREWAFRKANNFFKSSLPKKIDFFTWNSREEAKKVLSRSLGFADPQTCAVHSHFEQTLGHEISHVLANHSVKVEQKSNFIDEGVAACFDMRSRDKVQMLKDWLKTNNVKVVIAEVWEHPKTFPEDMTYLLGGILVKDLIETYGREKFLEFFKVQTLENARKVFGTDVDNVISRVESKVNGY